jgi:hypothetical protein
MLAIKLAVFAVAMVVGAAAEDKHPYYCDSDAFCDEHYPGTVCIPVYTYGVSKCTPNTAKRPACRGDQPGMCPSYQNPEQAYLNAQCVFVSEEYLTSTSSSASSSLHLLTSTSSSSSSSPEGSTSSLGSVSNTTISLANLPMFNGTLNNKNVTGQFVCLQVSECLNLAADTSACFPDACGAPQAQEQCSFQGTCTYKSKKKLTKRSCKCYAGFDGDKCQKEVSGACDVDCGHGGDCIDGQCVCKEGFDGKDFAGKKGNATQRCTRCTNDRGCEYNNSCNVDTGKCICAVGYSGDWCGNLEDSCTTRTDCGVGACQVLLNGSSACFCPQCSPKCTVCEMTGWSSFDCSTCPTDAAAALLSSKLVFAVAFVALLLVNLAL